jgi:hypothetical protein
MQVIDLNVKMTLCGKAMDIHNSNILRKFSENYTNDSSLYLNHDLSKNWLLLLRGYDYEKNYYLVTEKH